MEVVAERESGESGNNTTIKLFFKMARIKRLLEVKKRKRDSLATLVDGGVGTNSTMEDNKKDKLPDKMDNERENSPSEVAGDVGTNSTMEDLTKLVKKEDLANGNVGHKTRMDLKANVVMIKMDLATGNVGVKTRRDLKVGVDIAAVDGRNGEENEQNSFSFNNKESV